MKTTKQREGRRGKRERERETEKEERERERRKNRQKVINIIKAKEPVKELEISGH